MRFPGTSLWRVMSLIILLCGCATSHPARPRSGCDRPDDFSGSQIHILYLLPSDGADEQLDTDGTIARSLGAAQTWLADRTGGRSLRIDEYRGKPDVTFYRLPLSDSDLRSEGARVRDRIEEELNDVGFNSPDKIYAVYYGGTHDKTCADGFHSDLPGNVIALYLNGLAGENDPCADNPFVSDENRHGWEIILLHEIFHGLGAVADCAPNSACRYDPNDQHCSSHLGGDPRDLMYRGPGNWEPSIVDDKRDDYFGHGRLDCGDVSRSLFLTPPPPASPRS